MLQINISADEYLDLIEKLDCQFGFDAGDIVHPLLLAHMTNESREECTLASMKRFEKKLKKTE